MQAGGYPALRERIQMKVNPKKITPAFEETMSELMLGACVIEVIDRAKDPYSPESVLVTMLAPDFKNMETEDQHELVANVLINAIAKHNIQDAVDRLRDAHDSWIEANPNAPEKEKKQRQLATMELITELVQENHKATKPIFSGRNMKDVMADYNLDIRFTLLSGVAFSEEDK